jgi:hypothetical protein
LRRVSHHVRRVRRRPGTPSTRAMIASGERGGIVYLMVFLPSYKSNGDCEGMRKEKCLRKLPWKEKRV